MSTPKPLVEHDVIASTLRALGVALFAGIAVLVGLVLRWSILRDGSYTGTNLEQVNFMIAIAGLLATGALFMVALNLVKWPDRGP